MAFIDRLGYKYFIMTFSEIVNEVQGDKEKAGELLVKIAKEQKRTLKEIKEAESQLKKVNSLYNSTMGEIENIRKHIKIPEIFNIVKDKQIYLFKDNQVEITNIDWLL